MDIKSMLIVIIVHCCESICCRKVTKSLRKLYKMIIQLTLIASVFVCYGDSYGTNRRLSPIQEIENNRCFRDGNWYNNGEQMDSRGCCECWNGVMACGSCGGLDESELEISSYLCDNKYCEFGYNDDCSCKHECEEVQNFGECEVIHITELIESPKKAKRLFSYNTATRRCEPVLTYCSQTKANKFSSKKRCNKYCGGDIKGCYKDGNWYSEGDQMDTTGCCHCWNGIMACQSCHTSVESTWESFICIDTCEYGHNDDCSCKGDCQEACATCFSTGSKCPDECNCAAKLLDYLDQDIY